MVLFCPNGDPLAGCLRFSTATHLPRPASTVAVPQEYLFERKVKATDRTKPPEEVAKDEADRLHALESKRLARMAGDLLSEDELSDISGDEGTAGGRRTRRGRRGKDGAGRGKARDGPAGPEELSDSDDGGAEEEPEARFTADGLVYVDRDGRVVGRAGAEDGDEDGGEGAGDEDGSDGDEDDAESGDGAEEGDGLGGSDDEASAASGDGSADDPDLKLRAAEKKKKLKAKMRAK